MLKLETARQLIRDCFERGAELDLKPLSVAVPNPVRNLQLHRGA